MGPGYATDSGAKDAAAVTAVVLCGGRGTRLGGVEKPLLKLGDKTLVEHVIDALRPQVGQIVLSCACQSASYDAFELPVALDMDAQQGPLGGIAASAPLASTPWLLTVAADTPFLPRDMVKRLFAGGATSAGVVVATAGGRRQNLTMLLDRAHRTWLRDFYVSGGRAIHRWLSSRTVPEVKFRAEDFLNVNTPADLETAAAVLARRRAGHGHTG